MPNPKPTRTRSGGWFFNPQSTRTITDSLVRVADWWWSVSGEPNYHWNPSKRSEISPDPTRSCQIHPRSGEIPSNLARFLANRDEKSLVRPNPMFIMPKIDGFK